MVENYQSTGNVESMLEQKQNVSNTVTELMLKYWPICSQQLERYSTHIAKHVLLKENKTYLKRD